MSDRRWTTVIATAVALIGIAARGPLGAQDTAPASKPADARRAAGAQPAAAAAEKKAEDRVIRIFSLKYVPLAGGVPAALRIFEPAANIAVDARTNQVIVQATGEVMREIEGVLKDLDVPAAEQERIVKIFPLKHCSAGEAVRALEAFRGRAILAVAESRNSIIVEAAGESVLRDIEMVMREIDVPEPAGAASGGGLLCRLVWLVGDPPEILKERIPDDLKDVAGALERFGISPLARVAQVIVQTSSSGDFTIKSTPKLLKDEPCALQLKGKILASRPEGPQLQVSIVVHRESSPGSAQPEPPPALAEISTAITAPLRRPVVLCAAPTEGFTSVFVIQVLPAEAVGGK